MTRRETSRPSPASFIVLAFMRSMCQLFRSREMEAGSGLQDQPMQLLAFLVEKRGQIVTREELRQRLWPGNTFVDFDKSLGVAVLKAREALGDSATNPTFLETLPRRGYRFIAPVTVEGQICRARGDLLHKRQALAAGRRRGRLSRHRWLKLQVRAGNDRRSERRPDG